MKNMKPKQKKSELNTSTKLDITQNNQTQNLNNHNEENYITNFKDMIEKQDISSKADNFISDTLELLATNTLSNGREDKERYELIDKEELKELRRENNDLKDKEDELIEKYNSKVLELSSLSNQFLILKKRETVNLENVNLEKGSVLMRSKEYRIENEKLSKEIQMKRIKSDNLIRSLIYMKEYFNEKIPDELNKVVEKFNDENFKYSIMYYKRKELETLQNRLFELNNELKKYYN